VQREFARPVVKPHVWGDAKMSRDFIGCCWAAAAAAAAGSQIAAVAAVWRQAWSYKKKHVSAGHAMQCDKTYFLTAINRCCTEYKNDANECAIKN
jgi:hypothetical protein